MQGHFRVIQKDQNPEVKTLYLKKPGSILKSKKAIIKDLMAKAKKEAYPLLQNKTYPKAKRR